MTSLVAAQETRGMKTTKLVQDVATRWNSSCDMLASLVANRAAINKVLQADVKTDHFRITAPDFTKMPELVTQCSPNW